jgi:hypothetical protein
MALKETKGVIDSMRSTRKLTDNVDVKLYLGKRVKIKTYTCK